MTDEQNNLGYEAKYYCRPSLAAHLIYHVVCEIQCLEPRVDNEPLAHGREAFAP